VQPPELLPSDIHVALGSPWVPPDVVRDFTAHLFGQTLQASYVSTLAEWALKPQYYFNRHSPAVTSTWGTARVDGVTLLLQALNGKSPKVTDPDPGDDRRRVVNQAETLAAREMQDKIKQEFAQWVWSDPGRAHRLARLYNERFNRFVPRSFDGAHLTLPGLGADMPELRPHQKDAVWRVVQSEGNTLLGHVVGAGKTYSMIGAGMELRRLGLRNKVMHVVPNHMLEQYGDDVSRMYPGAKVLLVSARDLGRADKRAETMSRVATEDWDAVVVTHSAFGKLPMSKHTYTSFMRQEIGKLESELHAIKQEGQDSEVSKRSVKQIEKAKRRMEVKLQKYAAADKKDETVTFEQLGVDQLFVDEAHTFKNLYFPTRRDRVAGLAQSASQRAFDMYIKTQFLQRRCGTCGRFVSKSGVCHNCLGQTTIARGGVTFATGTPISNSIVEMYTMMRYLQPRRLRELGLDHFDAWAAQFGDTVTAMEMKPSGEGYREYTRFARFNNVPELLRAFAEVADIKADPKELNLRRPGMRGGGQIGVGAPPSPELREFIQECARRADNLANVPPTVDNMLKIVGEANLAALDMRLIDPSLPDNPDGKVNRAVDNVLDIYAQTTGVEVEGEDGPQNMAQVIFLDSSTPKAGKFNVYDDLKGKLVAGGIPEDEIAFIHDARNDAEKQRLFDRVNAGQVRVIVGSTEKMGSGTNVQRRLAALHHLDAPWRPADVEQREGRILRPGNLNREVGVYRYVTKESFDVYKWQILQSKARFIAQALS
jgi:N12 class adenine-specific DNA methylase